MGLPRCRRQVFGPHKTFSKVQQIAKDLTSSFYEIDPRSLLGDNSTKLLRFLTPAFMLQRKMSSFIHKATFTIFLNLDKCFDVTVVVTYLTN